jgi:hypothetical protein
VRTGAPAAGSRVSLDSGGGPGERRMASAFQVESFSAVVVETRERSAPFASLEGAACADSRRLWS